MGCDSSTDGSPCRSPVTSPDRFSTPPRRRGVDSSTSLPRGVRIVDAPFAERKPAGWTRFVCFSDTHGQHGEIPPEHRPEADVLLHAGDFTNTGELDQVQSFASWLKTYPAAEKVVIAGNHDVTFHEDYYKKKWSGFHPRPYDCHEVRTSLLNSGCCTYLEDSVAEVAGYTIYGSPWQPEFCDWAFNLPRGAECTAVWERIPERVDILITHGPPHGIGDRCSDGFHAGCEELIRAIRKRNATGGVPIHLAGHIHEGYGVVSDRGTLFINASTCTLDYQPSNPPVVFDVPPAPDFRGAPVGGLS